MPWRGAIKLTAPEPDVMISLELWSDYRAFANLQLTGRPTPMLVQFDPFIRYSVYVGRIARSGAIVDRHDGPPAGRARRPPRRRQRRDARCPAWVELTLAFPELRQYSVLLISKDVGIPMVLAAAILVLVGLIPALYVSRRKVWVRAEAAPGGALVKIGGFALQRKDSFENEFDAIVRAVGARSSAAQRTVRTTGTGGAGGDVVNAARLSSTAFDLTLWLYLGAMVLSFAYLAARRDLFWEVARVVAIAGVTANLVSIVARGVAAQRVPWGNMFEYSTVLAFLVVVGTLVFVEGVAKIKTLTGFSLMFSVLTLAIAAIFFPVEPSPLQPALNSYWIKIHVVAAITGSSLFAIGGIATILFLIKDRSERRALSVLRDRTPPPIMGGARSRSTRRTTSSRIRKDPARRPRSPRAAASCRPPRRSTAWRTA